MTEESELQTTVGYHLEPIAGLLRYALGDSAWQPVDGVNDLASEFRDDTPEVLPHGDDPLPYLQAHLLNHAQDVPLRLLRSWPNNEVRTSQEE